jgi:hypothetical protein
MSRTKAAARKDAGTSSDLQRVPARQILVVSPVIRFRLGPGDRTLVHVGESILPGAPLAERTPDADLEEAGRLDLPSPQVAPAPPTPAAPAAPAPEVEKPILPVWKESGSDFGPVPQPERVRTEAPSSEEESEEPPELPQNRRTPPVPLKWWVGGDERRGRAARRRDPSRRVAGTLLYEIEGRWYAAAGDRHETVESPIAGEVLEAQNGIGITIKATGVAIPGAVAGGEPSRGYLDVPRLAEGELRANALDVGRSGAIVVAGARVSAETLTRAHATAIRGMIAGSVGQGELRDLAASQARQRAGLHPLPPFAVLAFDGHQRRPIATPILTLLAAMAGRDVAIVTDPPLLVFDVMDVPLPELPPDWVRVRSGSNAGREGRWVGSAGLQRFRAGVHLEAAYVRLIDETAPIVIPLNDLERFVF